MSKPVDDLQSALLLTGLVQPVSAQQKGGWLEVLARQVPGQEKAWLATVDALLREAEAAGISEATILARRYLLKQGQMVFGWYLSIGLKNSKELAAATAKLVAVLEQHRPSLHVPAAPQVVRTAPPAEEEAGPLLPKPHRVADVSALTKARPRPPSDGRDPNPPPNGPRVALTRTGPDGKPEVVEMPLPHVYGELNKPKPGSLKGAKTMGGSN